MLVTGIAGLLAFAWYLTRENRRLQAEPSPQLVLKEIRSSDPTICRQIFACKGYDNSGAINLNSNVKSRAIPNEGLVRAFGIDNAFTTSDTKRRTEFNTKATNAIRMTEAQVSTPSERSLLLFWQAPILILRALRLLVGLYISANILGTPYMSNMSPRSNADMDVI